MNDELRERAEKLAEQLHTLRRETAPHYGQETGVPWQEVPEQQKELMIEVSCRIIEQIDQGDYDSAEHKNHYVSVYS